MRTYSMTVMRASSPSSLMTIRRWPCFGSFERPRVEVVTRAMLRARARMTIRWSCSTPLCRVS